MATTSSSASTSPSTSATGVKSNANNASAVYRWYEIEATFCTKKREESAIAKCKLCRQQGKMERKTCVRFSKSVTSNLWRHLKENHPNVYEKHSSEKRSLHVHQMSGAKKRGRKKKPAHPNLKDNVGVEQPPPITNCIERVLIDVEPLVKKPKTRIEVAYDLLDNPFHVGSRPMLAATARPSKSTSQDFIEKVQEAMGYLCLYELLPFELCSSPAFRNLIMECSKGGGEVVEDSTIFTKEIVGAYAKKLAAEVKVRTMMQINSIDFSHLVLSKWQSSMDLVVSALYAVGLDQDFHLVRRCLRVLSIGNCRTGDASRIATTPEGDGELIKAIDSVAFCQCMPRILTVEPLESNYQPFCSDHKLHCLASLPKVLQMIIIATIDGTRTSERYCLGSKISTAASIFGSVAFQCQRLDKGEYIESNSGPLATSSSIDANGGNPVVEIASSIFKELPQSLTGHMYRDIINKVMHLLAHFKASPTSRMVLQRLAYKLCSMDGNAFERLFIDRLRVMVISLQDVSSNLALVQDMMPVLKQYFLLHKNSHSDFSKLVQLCCLSRYEWPRVKHLAVILKPFVEATMKLNGEQHVVSSLIVPSAYILIEKLRGVHLKDRGPNNMASNSFLARKSHADVREDLPEDVEALRNLAFVNLSETFGYFFSTPEASWGVELRRTFHLLWSATILDPRTRSFIVKGSLTPQELWRIVKMEAANIADVKDKENGMDSRENGIAFDDINEQLNERGKSKETDLWDDLQANLASCAQEEMLLSSTTSSLEPIKSNTLLQVEVLSFQEEGRIALRANPLKWWQTIRMKYPFLARLARYVLSIPCNVKVDDNPVQCDEHFVKRGLSQMSMKDLCELLTASINLRSEKNSHFKSAS